MLLSSRDCVRPARRAMPHTTCTCGRYESYEGINVRLRCARGLTSNLMPDFEPHAACQPRATATVAKPRLPTSRRSYFLRVSVGRSYSGKLIHEETFRVQAQLAATRTRTLTLTLTRTRTLTRTLQVSAAAEYVWSSAHQP